MNYPIDRLFTALAFAGACAAARADYPIETFEGAQASNAAVPAGPIAGTGFELVAGTAWVAPANTLSHGNILDLASGWYASTFNAGANLGYTTVQTISTFDLLAGYTYSLSFDWSRQAFSAATARSTPRCPTRRHLADRCRGGRLLLR